LLPSAHAVDREFRAISALSAQGFPVAKPVIYVADESVAGTAFYVMSFVEGRVFWNPEMPGSNPSERTAVYDAMNDTLARLHSFDPAKIGLSDFGRGENYVARQVDRWSKQYRSSETQKIDEMERLIEWLPAHIPASARDETQVSVVHGDYRLDNVMFDPAAPRAIAVLDWELSTIGHPLADFSYHCMSWHIQPGQFRGLGGLDLAALGIPDEKSYVRRYCERTGRADPDAVMADWNFYLAYNMFRLAGILQGIAKRVEMGTASSAQARQAGAGAKPLAEMGWALAQRA
jgi:aminoglycoside phosphotransferase (APT) family kinase protein